jgi:hypothetical protein
MLFILVVCAVNFALGFALAVGMGHGPANLLRMVGKRAQGSSPAHAESPPANTAH